MRIAINGAGIAGSTLAYWLQRCGHEVLLVEEAPRLREGGYVVDFWGVGYDVAERMGLLPRVRELGYQVREVRFVDGDGRRTGGFPAEAFSGFTGGRFTSVRRSDLAATIHDALGGKVETIFGDSIAAIEEGEDHVRIGFDRAPPREVELVVGADGLHSRVRSLVFSPGEWTEISLGYHVAAFEAGGYRPRDELVYVTYGLPGRQISRFAMRGDRTLFLCVFRNEYLPSGEPDARKVVLQVFADAGWECPRILAAMDSSSEVYFDRVSQIRMPRWTRGRTALVGDAAAGVSLLAGEGTGLAMAEAYVLAGELHACGGDHATAFARYEERMMQFLERKRESARRFASSFAPRTAAGIRVRNLVTRLLRFPLVSEILVARDLRDDVDLPDYRLPG